jgi:bifunctional DNase/RNase
VHLSSPSGDKIISARPSDAVALAVRCNAPLFATDELMEAEAQEAPAEPEVDAAEIIDDFKDFLDNVSPEDFEA